MSKNVNRYWNMSKDIYFFLIRKYKGNQESLEK